MKIAIASGKGGTGKTTLATNLASFLAETEKIILVDLDVEEPNSGLFISGENIHEEDKFKMIPEWKKDECILCGNCQKVCNFNAVMKLGEMIMVFPELCHGCYACSELCPTKSLPMKPKKMGELKHFKSGNLVFIESKLIIGEEQAVPLIKQTLNYVDRNFPKRTIEIFDAPPGTSCPVIEATKDADLILLVTEPTPFGLHDLKLAVETMKELKKEMGVIINRFGIGDANVERYCEKNNIPIIAKIPNMRKIAEIYSEGNLLYKKIPEVKTQLEDIIAFISKFQQEVTL
ncbi:MAG: ATP-binding protein [Candidatus Cloacimonetes bacterium]|jgi:MinD superfamily P-loop ATPase|nr:ATP-binding protein [Candidatus Cloacimonadota bacterium]